MYMLVGWAVQVSGFGALLVLNEGFKTLVKNMNPNCFPIDFNSITSHRKMLLKVIFWCEFLAARSVFVVSCCMLALSVHVRLYLL